MCKIQSFATIIKQDKQNMSDDQNSETTLYGVDGDGEVIKGVQHITILNSCLFTIVFLLIYMILAFTQISPL